MDHSEPVTVYTVSNSVEAEIIKNALEGEGIRCFVANESQAGESGLSGFPIRIDVAAADADRARAFVMAHERGRLREDS